MVTLLVGILAFIATLITWPGLATLVFKLCFPNILWEVNTADPFVSLTFDDGPDLEYTPQILEILARYEVKATFFLVGERARNHPYLVKAIREAGHEIGNHSNTWKRSLSLSGKDFEEDLTRAEESLELSDSGMKFFRPAGGLLRPSHVPILKKYGYVIVLGSGYVFDPYQPPASYIGWGMGRSLRPGAILVLHDSGGDRSNTVRALPNIITRAYNNGLGFVTLSDLLKSQTDSSHELQ